MSFVPRKRIFSYVVEGSNVVWRRGEREERSEARRSRIDAASLLEGARELASKGALGESPCVVVPSNQRVRV